MSSREMITCIVRQPPSVLSAESQSPRPMNIDARGAPPEATKAEKAETMSISGMQTPMSRQRKTADLGDVPDVNAVNDVVQHVHKLRDDRRHGELRAAAFLSGCVPRNDLSFLHVDALLE